MRPALLLCASLLATVVLAAACGGSSSETPWPQEPAPALMAPPPDVTPLAPSAEDDAGARKRKE